VSHSNNERGKAGDKKVHRRSCRRCSAGIYHRPETTFVSIDQHEDIGTRHESDGVCLFALIPEAFAKQGQIIISSSAIPQKSVGPENDTGLISINA
jgi:hypothetical protein